MDPGAQMMLLEVDLGQCLSFSLSRRCSGVSPGPNSLRLGARWCLFSLSHVLCCLNLDFRFLESFASSPHVHISVSDCILHTMRLSRMESTVSDSRESDPVSRHRPRQEIIVPSELPGCHQHFPVLQYREH
jgi:hypothetical protein